MKFVAHEDVAAPIDFVFEQVTDFPSIERSALRRGAEVQRVDSLPETGPGMMWEATFSFRGKRREVTIELTKCDEPNGIEVGARSPNIKGQLVLDLVALSRARTRISVTVDMHAKTLAAKLLLQSLKLARSNLTKRFTKRVAEYAADLEDRHKGATV